MKALLKPSVDSKIVYREYSRLIPRGIVVLLGFTLCGCERFTGDKEIESMPGANDPGYSVTGAELIETDASGLPRYRLQAKRIVQDPRSQQIDIENPVLGLLEAGSPAWTVSADRGQLPSHARSIRLAGHVEVSSTQQEREPELRVETDMLDYDFSSGIAKSDTVVSLTINSHRIQGLGLEADLRRRQARLKESVQGRFAP